MWRTITPVAGPTAGVCSKLSDHIVDDRALRVPARPPGSLASDGVDGLQDAVGAPGHRSVRSGPRISTPSGRRRFEFRSPVAGRTAISIVIAGVMIYYLSQPHARRAFGQRV
ncbi:MAG: hypothetical protein ABSG37_04985 [Candidatus Limnocylindrales bacterium]